MYMKSGKNKVLVDTLWVCSQVWYDVFINFPCDVDVSSSSCHFPSIFQKTLMSLLSLLDGARTLLSLLALLTYHYTMWEFPKVIISSFSISACRAERESQKQQATKKTESLDEYKLFVKVISTSIVCHHDIMIIMMIILIILFFMKLYACEQYWEYKWRNIILIYASYTCKLKRNWKCTLSSGRNALSLIGMHTILYFIMYFRNLKQGILTYLKIPLKRLIFSSRQTK